jgi:DNA-binding CsgD family transcriptional regulator
MAKEELLDRQDELAAIDARLAGTADEEGGLLVIDGPAGIGKTSLLRAAIERARSQGVRTLCGWAAPLTQDLAFGITREIFEPVRNRSSPAEWEALSRGAAGLASAVLDDTGRDWPDAGMAAVHGLYWLTANLSGAGPLLIAVDDLQWADSGSLRWLSYLTRRLDGLPVLVLVTVRTGEHGPAQALLTDVLAAAAWRAVHPAPLGEPAAALLVRRDLEKATAEFCRACHSATGGNPFLLRALAISLRAEGVDPTDDAALDVAEFGPENVAVALERRLTALPPEAGPFLEAVAVLGSGATLRHCAALAGLDLDTAAHLADRLTGVGVLEAETLRFIHPVMRSAVTRRTGIGARGLAHGRAARLLAADGVPPDRLAPHLLQTHPSGDPWVVAALRAASRIAVDRGTPDTAEAYLRRALTEPPEPAERPLVLHELAMALSTRRDAEGPRLFQSALAELDDSPQRGELALAATRACSGAVMWPEAVAIGTAGLAGALDPVTRLRLESEVVISAWLDQSTAPQAWAWVDENPSQPATGTTVDALVQVVRATAVTFRSGPASEAVTLLRQALSGGVFEERGSFAGVILIMGLIYNEELDEAARISDEQYRLGQELASLTMLANYGFLQGVVALRRGALAQAEQDLRACYEFNRAAETRLGLPIALAELVDVLTAAGDLDGAEQELHTFTLDRPLPDSWGLALLLDTRGALRLAQGRHDEALADLDEARRLWNAVGITHPSLARWRAPMARVLARLGRHDQARRVAGENLELARATGLARPVGVALHTLGTIGADISRLEEAAEMLRGGQCSLELAQTLVDLGAAVRRSGRRSAAQEPLREALELAHRCGAAGTAAAAREELRIAGGRPRRPVRSGIDALTPQERRVALLAAEGLSNREVAERLFVSERTVETHLQHVFQKLGVGRRSGITPLVSALAAAGKP